MKKRSFFEKLTGASRIDEFEYDDFEDEIEEEQDLRRRPRRSLSIQKEESMEIPERQLEDLEEISGELSVDVLNNEDHIIIKSMVAGVKPQDLDIQISRDMITIEGTREEDTEINQGDYYHRELYWGKFSRRIVLPEEVDVELAEAKENHGLLIIKLPKIDKTKKAKIQVKSI